MRHKKQHDHERDLIEKLQYTINDLVQENYELQCRLKTEVDENNELKETMMLLQSHIPS